MWVLWSLFDRMTLTLWFMISKLNFVIIFVSGDSWYYINRIVKIADEFPHVNWPKRRPRLCQQKPSLIDSIVKSLTAFRTSCKLIKNHIREYTLSLEVHSEVYTRQHIPSSFWNTTRFFWDFSYFFIIIHHFQVIKSTLCSLSRHFDV